MCTCVCFVGYSLSCYLMQARLFLVLYDIRSGTSEKISICSVQPTESKYIDFRSACSWGQEFQTSDWNSVAI